VTVFAPTNTAMSKYRGLRGEKLILNHLVNSVVMDRDIPDRLSSLVTGSPPIWVTRRSGWLYLNQARATERDIQLTSDSGLQQVMFVIDSVLEPLVPTSIKNATYTQHVTALKLLQRSTLYNLGSNGWARVFYALAKKNQRDKMFGVAGRHTFFFPIDSAFDVIARENVDSRVIEAHIVPGQLLISSLNPTKEFPTVVWEENRVRVNLSLQPSGGVDGGVMVRSNTIEGDRFHGTGMVVARIVKGDIPVQNGVVHLIDRPLMVVARSLYDYVMEEGSKRSNRLYKFAQLIKDKGGRFGEMLLESKDGTLLAPSNEAFEKVDMMRLEYIMGHQKLRNEMFGLHFVRERISSTDKKIRAIGEQMYSVPASWASNRIWIGYERNSQTLTIEGRGVNTTALEKDIGTVNGVIHVVDRFLGIPYQSLAEKMESDPIMSHTWSLAVATRLDRLFSERSDRKMTMIVPVNSAWEKVRTDFSTVFLSLTDVTQPQYPANILKRHLIVSNTRDYTIEELVERSSRTPGRQIDTEAGKLIFTGVGEVEFNAYKEWYVSWQGVKAKIIRPNIEVTNGYIHLVDTVLIDDSPAWSVLSVSCKMSSVLYLVSVIFLLF